MMRSADGTKDRGVIRVHVGLLRKFPIQHDWFFFSKNFPFYSQSFLFFMRSWQLRRFSKIHSEIRKGGISGCRKKCSQNGTFF